MAAADKDLETLRKEHKDLSDYTGRMAIIFLTVLSLIVISFSRSCNRVKSQEVATAICQINEVNIAGKCGDRNISYIFKFHDEQHDFGYRQQESAPPVCTWPCAEVSLTPTPTPTPTPSGSSVASPSVDPSPTPSPSPSANPSAAAPPISTPTVFPGKTLCDCERSIEEDLEKKAQSWFALKSPIPGMDLSIDLRYWVGLLPMLFCLCGVYLRILRKKQDLLRALAIQRLREVKPGEVTELDRFYFTGEAPYLSYPSKLTSSLFLVCYWLLPIYLGYVAWSSWNYGGAAIVYVAPLVLAFVVYSVAFSHFVSSQFDKQISALAKVEMPRNLISSALGYGKSLLEKAALNGSPRIPLFAGSVLVLMTWFVAITQQKLWRGNRYVGSKVALDGSVIWFTAIDFWDGPHPFYASIARVIYVLALVLGGLVLLLSIPGVYSMLSRKWIRTVALGLTGSLFVVALVDLAAGISHFFEWEISGPVVIQIAVCLITVWLWIRYSGGDGTSERERWRRIRSGLMVFYAPIFLICIVFVIWLRLWGLLTLLFGTGLIALGFMQVQYRFGLVRNGPPKT